jgi:L-aspartate oxidase
MPDYHPLADLAPRDIVARAIKEEMQKHGTDHVWLDITDQEPEFVQKRFPTIYNTCLKHGIDMTKELVPVVPAAHYMMGGVRTDISGATRIPGLYACGEVACNGVHGSNRLASNSLLEGLVFGYRIIEKTFPEWQAFSDDLSQIPLFVPEGKNTDEHSLTEDDRKALQKLLTELVGITRSEEGLHEALQQLEEWSPYLQYACSSMEEWEIQNMLLIASVVVQSALIRKESRGAHYRSDYPSKDVNYQGRHFTFSREPERSDSVELES